MEDSKRSGSGKVSVIFDGKLVTVVGDDDEMTRVEERGEADAAGRCWCSSSHSNAYERASESVVSLGANPLALA